MDLFIDMVAWASMPGILCVMVAPAAIGIGMPLMLLVGVLEGVPVQAGERSAIPPLGERDGSRAATGS